MYSPSFFLIFYFYSSPAEAWLQAFYFRIPEETKRFRKWPSISIYNLYTYFWGNKKWWKVRPAELKNSSRSFLIFCTKNKKTSGEIPENMLRLLDWLGRGLYFMSG